MVKNDPTEGDDTVEVNNNERLSILFWNKFWNWPFYAMGEGNTGFVNNRCKYTNCYTTKLRKKILEKGNRIDAVVVHGWDSDLARLAHTRVSTTYSQGWFYVWQSTIYR